MNISQPFYLSRYFTRKGILCYSLLLVLCFLIFYQQASSFQWIAFGIVEVVGFFYFSNVLTRKWAKISAFQYQRRLFWGSFLIRSVWVVFSYFYFTEMTGLPFEYEAGDSMGYYGEAQWLYGLAANGQFDIYLAYIGINYSDMGYPMYLTGLWFIFGDSIIVPRLIKALLSAFTCVLMYRIGRRNFGEAAGRIAGVFGMLLPNLIYYTGLHVKETEMLILTVLFIYCADSALSTGVIKPRNVVYMCLAAAALFFFRTVLAVCLISSLTMAVFFTSRKVSDFSKKIGLLVLIVAGAGLIFATPLGDTIHEYIDASDDNLDSQMSNFATRQDGANKLAKYGSRSIFLPFMLMVPFPTMVDTAQYNSMMLNGAFFTRNVYAFFVFVALYVLYKRRQLRAHMLLLTAIASYLFVIGSSGFALSERFHLPIVPLLLVLAAYGVTQVNLKNRKYYLPYLAFVVVLVIGWNWFKLAGRA